MSFDLAAPPFLDTAICAAIVSMALLSLAIASGRAVGTRHRRGGVSSPRSQPLRFGGILGGPMRPVSLGRPRWENLLLVASVIIFWAGVILKIIG